MREESFDVTSETAGETQPLEHSREKPDGMVDPAGEAGWYLQREREARGETLDDASAQTGIHPYHIEAIEYGDMTHMPGRMDALEMIGTYAQYLGFDPEPLVEHYAHFLPAPSVAPKTGHPANPQPLSSAKVLRFGPLAQLPKFAFRLNAIPGGAGGLVATLAGAVFLFAGASYILSPGSGGSELGSGQVATVETDPLPQDDDADPMPTASTNDDVANVTVGDEPMPDEQATAAAPADDDLAGTNLNGISSLIENEIPGARQVASELDGLVSATDMALTDDGREFGAGNGESRLTLKAKAPVWVRIEDAQGNVVMTQMLMKGDTYRVPNREGLVVIARDGGLLSYVIDGKEKGILGTPGEILVGRSLDIKSFGGSG